MAYNKIGRIRPAYVGEWSSGKSYDALDIVKTANGSMSYIAQKDVPAGTPLSNSSYWALVLDVQGTLDAVDNAIQQTDAAASRADAAVARVDNAGDVKMNALTSSVSGNFVKITAEEHSVIKPHLVYEPIQSGIGDPYPAGAGKQLFDISSCTSTGISIDADGWVTVNLDNTGGTSIAYKSVYTPPSAKLSTGKQYTVVTEIKEISGCYLISVGTTDTSNKAQFATGISYNSAGTRIDKFTTRDSFSDCVTMLRSNVCVYSGEVGKCVFRISVLEDLTITADNFMYMPYANTRKISGRSVSKLTQCGKNLINPTYTSGSIYGAAIERNGDYYVLDGTPSTNGVATIATMVLDPGVYTISHTIISGSYVSDQYCYIAQLVDKAKNVVLAKTTRYRSSDTYTITERLEVTIRIYGRMNAVYDNFTVAVQLEKNSAATLFEPFDSNVFTLNLNNTVYGGKLDWNEGFLTITHRKFSVNNSADVKDFEYKVGSSGIHYVNFFLPVNLVNNSKAWANSYKWIKQSDASATGLFRTYGNAITIYDMAFTSTDQALQYLKDMNFEVVCELAEPIVVQLTPNHISAPFGERMYYSDADQMTIDYNLDLTDIFKNNEDIHRDKSNGLKTSLVGNPVQIYPDEGSLVRPVLTFGPTQSVSGDPYPAGCGKNLFDLSTGKATSSNVVEISGNQVRLYTTKDAGYCSFISDTVLLRANVQYTLSCFVDKIGIQSSFLRLCMRNTSNTIISTASMALNSGVRVSKTFTMAEDTEAYVSVVCTGSNNEPGDVTVSNIMLEESSVATKYAPYANICPIIGKTSMNVTRCGKNLIPYPYSRSDVYSSNGITYVVNADKSITVNGTATAESLYALTTNLWLNPGTYRLDGVPAGDFGGSANPHFYMRDNFSGGFKKSVYASGGSITITKAGYHTIFIDIMTGNTFTNAVFKPILVAGSASMNYEPYQGNMFTLNLGQTIYGGTLDLSNGLLMIDYGYAELTGSENTSIYQSESLGNGVFFSDILPVAENRVDGICSHTIVRKNINMTGHITVGNNNRGIYWPGILKMLGLTTKEEFNEWAAEQRAAGTPVQIAYKLTTPVVIQLDPVKIAALANMNTVYSDADEMTVNYNKDLAVAYKELLDRFAAIEAAMVNDI